MRYLLSVFACSLAFACGGEDGPGSGTGGNGGNGGNGSNCGGGQFDIEWTRDRSGQASGDCVVTTVSSTNGPIPGEYLISVVEEGSGELATATFRINRDTLDPIGAVFSPADDVVCAESAGFDGNFEGALTFNRRDANGFELSVVANMGCTDETQAEPVNFEVQLTGTVSGSRELD